MYKNLSIIIKENINITFRQSIVLSIIFLSLIPYIYGIHNLNSEKAADCLGKIVIFISIPMFTFIAKPEQDSNIRDIILIKEFPYRILLCFRIILAVILSIIMIYCFELYMLSQDCEFPIYKYTIRTAEISILLGGIGLIGSILSKNTVVGFLLSISFIFLFYHNFAIMILKGIYEFIIIFELLLYLIILLLCDK